jgi:hypothetical protein
MNRSQGMFMKKFAALLCGLMAVVAVPAHASDDSYGYASTPLGMTGGAVLFNSDGSRGTVPSCQGPGLGARWAINASTLVGQSQLSVFMTAYSLHKRVFIHGTGTCSIWGDTETVDYLAVEN